MSRAALIGVTHWHVPLMLRGFAAAGLDLAAVWDPARYDCVFASGPPRSMPGLARAVLVRRLPLSLEKPCACSTDEVVALHELAQAAGVPVAVPLVQRYAAVGRHLMQLAFVDPPLEFSVRFIAGPPARYERSGNAWMLDPAMSGGGAAINLAVHFVDLAILVCGSPVTEVSGLMSAARYGRAVEDLAVLTLTKPPAGLKPMAIGDWSALSVGDPVMAIGNPLGLAGTVTTGIVSAVNRPVRTSAADSGARAGQAAEPVVTNAIQTSAAINPGNSGGALVNAGGQLIGINSSIATLSNGSESGNIGIGFAIPVNEARQIAEQLIATGTAEHAYLGVTPVDGQATMGDSTMSGAQLDSVGSATPAAQAGLKVGDVIIAVDGERVESADSLVGSIRSATKGQVVTLTVIRDGQELEISATLAAKPTVQN